MKKESYLCDACNRKFLCSRAVDGFKDGYDTGFLCPFCHTNLIQTYRSDDPENLEYGYTFLILSAIYMYFVMDTEFTFTLIDIAWLNELILVFSIYLVLSTPFILINRKLLFGSKTVFTKKYRKRIK